MIVNDLYEQALALYDEISKNGTVDASKTADYKARTPRMADTLQKELWNTADYTKIHEFDYETTDGLLKITLPAKFKEIKKVILTYDLDDYFVFSNYKIEKDGSVYYLYMRFNYPCAVRVQYKPYPTQITTINDVVELDDITSQGIVYGLTKWFAISEQNEFVAKYCDDKFYQIKNTKVIEPAEIEQVVDVYSVRW